MRCRNCSHYFRAPGASMCNHPRHLGTPMLQDEECPWPWELLKCDKCGRDIEPNTDQYRVVSLAVGTSGGDELARMFDLRLCVNCSYRMIGALIRAARDECEDDD